MFEDIDLEKFQTKYAIAETAAKIFTERNGSFTLKEIGRELDIAPARVFDFFSSKRSILKYYYEAQVIRYHLMIREIEDFQSYSLSEKISNFMYASFDMLEEQLDFVEQTFPGYARRCGQPTNYEKHIEKTLRSFFEDDTRVSIGGSLLLRSPFFALLRYGYLQLISIWLNDETEGREQTMELIDKLTAFTQELMYSSVSDKGLKLAKFLVSNGIITQNIPFWDRITSNFEIRT